MQTFNTFLDKEKPKMDDHSVNDSMSEPFICQLLQQNKNNLRE